MADYDLNLEPIDEDDGPLDGRTCWIGINCGSGGSLTVFCKVDPE